MKKRLHVKVELELHAITCPGVWLCPSGYIEVTVKSLGYFFKAGPMEPKFPLLCHELFEMEGYFKSVDTLSHLEKALNVENVEITVWQNGRRLAYYRGKLGNMLQSLTPHKSCAKHSASVQLLMNPSRNFPGVLAPKIEMNARAVVQNSGSSRHCHLHRHPQVVLSCLSMQKDDIPHEERHNNLHEFKRQRPVCHASKRTKPQVVRRNFDSCTQVLKRDGNNPVYILAQNIRYANHSASKSTSRRSSNSTFPSSSDYLTSQSNDTDYNDNRATSNESDEETHFSSCHICQSYKDIFSSSR